MPHAAAGCPILSVGHIDAKGGVDPLTSNGTPETSRRDSFRISVKAHSFICEPYELSKSFGISPAFTIVKGNSLGSVTASRSSWLATFATGMGSEDFGASLEKLLALFDREEKFIHQLTSSGGEIVVHISQTVGIDEGLIFKLSLEPFFLRACGLLNIGLQVQAFTAEASTLTAQSGPTQA